MFHVDVALHSNPLDIREELDEALSEERAAIAKRWLPPIAARLRSIVERLLKIRRAARRAVASLQGRLPPRDEAAADHPELRHNARVARVGHRASILVDLIVGTAISLWVYETPLAWAVVTGALFSGAVAGFSMVVAIHGVDYRSLGRSIASLRRVVAGTWLGVLVSIVLIFLARGDLLPLSVTYFVTPLLAVALGLQAGALAALARAYAYLPALHDEAEQLRLEQSQLEGLRDELEAVVRSRTRARTAKNRGRRMSGASRGGHANRTRGSGRGRALAAIAVLLALQPLSPTAPACAGTAVEPERIVISIDVSDTGEMTDEMDRVRRSVAEQCSTLVDAIGSVQEVEVHRWASAEDVWAGGVVFSLPGQVGPSTSGEVNLPIFGYARHRLTERARAACRPRLVAVYREIARAVVAQGPERIEQSCPHDAVARALERGPTNLTILISDLEPHQCPDRPAVERGGGRVVVIQVPQRDGSDTRSRMIQRRERVLGDLPDVLVVDSQQITGPSALAQLVRRVEERAAEVGP